MYNLQSGMHRQRFPKLQKAAGRQGQTGQHLGHVTGIKVDSLNMTLTSCGADGKVKFWDFQKGTLSHELDWRTPISTIQFHRPSDLIGMSCGDGSVRVIDIGTRKLVRELWTPGQVVDFSFSNDGRWIVSATSESMLLVHDLSTGHLIEALRFRDKPVAVGFSNTGEYLATAHENSIGVHLWTNKTLFTHVPTRRIGLDEIVDVDIPTAAGGENLIGGVFEEDSEEPDAAAASTVDQLSSDLLTLSLVPKSRWQSLLHLDTIRERNKPKEPPQKPKSAPFFLPTDAKPLADEPAEAQAPASRITRIADPAAATTTALTSLLGAFAADPASDAADVAALLAGMAPPAADVTIRTLDPAAASGELVTFVRVLTARLRRRRDYELVQAWMAVFLRCHANVVVESAELREALGEWRAESRREAERLAGLVGYVKAVVGFAGGVV
jgi:U3 small nucleolar RNA-associated protein 21